MKATSCRALARRRNSDLLSPSLPRAFLVVSMSFGLLVGCDDSRQNRARQSSDSWQYPVQLGDPRARVHELLGAPSRTTPELEEYPLSGVTVWFDGESRVTKFNFAGEASAVYSSSSFDPIPSDRQVLYGLTGYTDEGGFRRALGTPVKEDQERPTSVRELRCVWKRDGYVVDSLFLVAERTHAGKIYHKGNLIWFEISPGL